MFFEAVDKTVVPLKTEIAQVGSERIFHDTSLDVAIEVLHLTWEEVTAVYDFLTIKIFPFSCTSMRT